MLRLHISRHFCLRQTGTINATVQQDLPEVLAHDDWELAFHNSFFLLQFLSSKLSIFCCRAVHYRESSCLVALAFKADLREDEGLISIDWRRAPTGACFLRDLLYGAGVFLLCKTLLYCCRNIADGLRRCFSGFDWREIWQEALPCFCHEERRRVNRHVSCEFP